VPTNSDSSVSGDPALPGIERSSDALEQRLRAAVESKGPDYRPRTHHLGAGGRPTYVNRLILEGSPYLLQHAHNPVNWYPWGDAAFERAKKEHKPVLVSIGYSTCHWCHVMERESFEDVEIATFLNQHFVAIKVDREERPDVDDVYMTAVQLMTGHGGWPMNVILTPDRAPFFGGTYFPPRDGERGTRYGFLTVLRSMHAQFEAEPEKVAQRAAQLSKAMVEDQTAGGGASRVPGPSAITTTGRQVMASFDQKWGGFGAAPKFPRPANLDFMLRYARRADDDSAREAVEHTLDQMIAGGIHDHVGGGFHRYAVDTQWLVPHFEKMLYDNAQLVVTLLEASQGTRDPKRRDRFRRAASETIDYLDREMLTPGGAYVSATDADSKNPEGELEEGWFFTWTPAELQAELGRQFDAEAIDRFGSHYGVTPSGNFEGRSILHQRGFVDDPKVATSFADMREVLYRARTERPPPLRDDKVLAAWNGLMLSALARAGFVLDESRHLERARRLATFLLEQMRGPRGRLLRSHHGGRAAIMAYLDDYAFVVQGMLDLFEATGEANWLAAAIELQARLDEHYWDDDRGGYFMTADDAQALLVRAKPDYDGAEPSGNSVATLNLLRLHELTDDDTYRVRAEAALAAFSSSLTEQGRAVPKLMMALDWRHDRVRQIVVVVGADGPDALLDALRGTFVPNAVRIVVDSTNVATLATSVPALEGKRALDGRTTAYVCEQRVCEAPTHEPQVLREQLGAP